MKNRKLFFLINLPIWLAILAYILSNGFYQYLMKDIGGMSTSALKMNIFHNINVFICLIVSFYTFYSFLVPNYLLKRRKTDFLIYSLSFVLIMPIVVDLFDSLIGVLLGESMGFFNIFIKHPSMFDSRQIFYGWLFWFIIISICGFLGYIFRLAFSSFQNEQQKQELEIKNRENEIKVLKSKLNPHFLFNTINNIDTLIQSRPPMASAALTKLSDILRYMVYETENELIPIETEIENLEKYIDLEKIRLINPNSVSFISTIKNDFDVPPLIFFPFVENGFKHSNLNITNQKLQISLSDKNNSLLFKCTNTIYERKQEKDFKGVGLELAKKRLDLLYPNKYELSIKKENSEFHVSLQIDLNK